MPSLPSWRSSVAYFAALTFFAATVLVPALASLGGYGWLLGAGLGGLFYYGLMHRQRTPVTAAG